MINMYDVNIPDEFFYQIVKCIGYPLLTINEEESDIEYTMQEIKQLAVAPAVIEYYKWFPIMVEQEEFINGEFSIDYPDEYTIGVLHVSDNTNLYKTSFMPTMNPFINAAYFYMNAPSKYGNSNYGTSNALMDERLARQSLVDLNKAFKVYHDKHNKKIIGFCNMNSRLYIQFAKYSPNFIDIPYIKIPEVIKLAQSYLLEGLGTLRKMQKTDLPNSFDADFMLDKAKEYKEDVVDNKWKKYSKTVVMKS
jgi:hypothetical protein